MFDMDLDKEANSSLMGLSILIIAITVIIVNSSIRGTIDPGTALLLLIYVVLLMITGVYAIFTYIIAVATTKQTKTILRQNKIADIEKRLEKVYNPCYEILRTFRMFPTKSTFVIPILKYKKLCNIFETYSYLASKEVINQWYSTIGNNKKINYEDLVTRKGPPPKIKQSLLHLIDKERNDLIAEHEKLVNIKNNNPTK